MPDIPGSDCNAVRDRYISVTPLGDDLTRYARLGDLAQRLGASMPTAAGRAPSDRVRRVSGSASEN